MNVKYGNWTLQQVTLPEAMQAFLDGKIALVKWDTMKVIEKNVWCELNVNHLQRGEWYVKVPEQEQSPVTVSLQQEV